MFFLPKNKNVYVMVLNIVKLLNGTYQVSYALKTIYNNNDYRGLIVVEYKTSDISPFNNFKHWGKWRRASIDRAAHILRLC
ncbi:MAG TPA: hypothetical protein GX725_02870 [Mollicutes bacterium]|nr:hypothetical protein [Mollicutes bacterium]